MEPEKHYAQRISSTELELGKVKARIMRVSMLRVILFVAGIVGIIWLYPTDSWICGYGHAARLFLSLCW